MPENKSTKNTKIGRKKVEGGSNISNTEWGIVVSLLFIIDIAQIILNFLVIGVFVNRLISIAVGFAWPTYLTLRGVSLTTRRAGSIILSFLVELIPAVDSFTSWGIDGIYVMLSVKLADRTLKKTKLGRAALFLASKNSRTALAAKGATEAETAGAEVGGTLQEEAFGAESAGSGGETLESGGESGISDEYADSIGEENNSRGGNQGEPDDYDAARDENNFDTDHQTSDEDADRLGKESDERDDKKMGGNKNSMKNPGRRRGQTQQRPPQNQGAENQNPLNLRQPGREDGFRNKDGKTDRYHNNFLDLANSYRGGVKNPEDEERSFGA